LAINSLTSSVRNDLENENGLYIIIPVTRRVNGYTRFVRKYVTGRRT